MFPPCGASRLVLPAVAHQQIPLPPDEVYGIWKAVEDLDFEDTHGAFFGRDTRGASKQRVLDSAKLFIDFMGYSAHPIHKVQL